MTYAGGNLLKTGYVIDGVNIFRTTALPFFYASFGIVSCVLNISLIGMIIKKRKAAMPFEYTLLNLAVADLMYGIGSTVGSLGIKYISINHNIYQAFIGCSVAAGIFAIFSSTFHIIFIVLERTIAVYLFIKKPKSRCYYFGMVFIFYYSHCMCCRHQ